MRLNRPGEARGILSGLDPDRGEIKGSVFHWQNLAEAQHLFGDHRAELRVATEARKRHPDDGVTALIEVRALAATGRTAELNAAIERIVAAASTAPFAGTLMREAGQELLVHGHTRQARAIGERASEWYRARIAADPANPRLRASLTRAKLISGADNATTQDLRELSLGPEPFRHGRGKYWSAVIAGTCGKCDSAIAQLRDAVAAGQEFGMEIHSAAELQPIRRCAQWRAFAAPRG